MKTALVALSLLIAAPVQAVEALVGEIFRAISLPDCARQEDDDSVKLQK